MKLRTLSATIIAIALCMGCASQHTFADAEAKGKRPLKVYILAGQSNMTGMAEITTLEHIKMVPDTAKKFADLFDEKGKPVVLDDVYVSQWLDKDGGKLAPGYGGGGGDKLGPEYAFGIDMHKKLQEPILLIKTSLGGSSLNFRFRSPSSGTWTPPPGHPDLIKKEDVKLSDLPIPEKLDIPDDWVPEKPYRLRSRHLNIGGFKGAVVGKMNGVSPIYIKKAPRLDLKGDPFKVGDLIIGIDGAGMRDDCIQHWRDAWFNSKAIDGDWMITVTRWRNGNIETFDFDIADTLEGGRAKLPEKIEEMKQAKTKEMKKRGYLYRDMIAHVQTVLEDVKAHHPAYDSEAGYELAGFVWFQGWNDMIDGETYPNKDKPRGYEQYTWLLENLIRDVRKDLDAPDMPAVIGVMGVGGVQTEGMKGYFQEAQAAVAEKPEFKETVANVYTGKYWDHDLEALFEKSNKIRKKSWDFKHEDGLEGEALKEAYAEYRAKHITPEEERLLKTAISNQDFHYLGSAKILCGIGKGFAEAMIELEGKRD